jgi:predicted ATP-grasp superfamily ATP-dependent carboligase
MPVQPLTQALVVGFTIHGLAVARALAKEGVCVHCLSERTYLPLPTTYTRFASVHVRPGLNTAALTELLLELNCEIASRHKIVLFPTSDRIAQTIARNWNELGKYYLLSWSDCRDLVLQLQRKDSLQEHCRRAGVAYPVSKVLINAEDCWSIAAGLRFPLAVKPVQPLSSFKAIRVEDTVALERCVTLYQRDLPFVVQEWIDGPEPSLYSCTSYLVSGRPTFVSTSRKVAASPPGTGQGTVFETIDEPEIKEIATKFFQHLDLTGPVAVEFKRDGAGRFWVIEPNVGRTEYCVDLTIQSGFNLPYIEYLHVTGGEWERAMPATTTECAWFDTNKDPTCFLANFGALRGEAGRRRRAVFPFLGHGDWRPLAASLRQQIFRQIGLFSRRLAYVLRAALHIPTVPRH